MAACNTQQNYDKISELKAFDDTKAGVKGLIDGGITKVPQIFIHPEALEKETTNPKNTHFIFPLIDLQNININNKEIVKQIQEASETWGFFQVINHGIPVPVLDEMLRGARRFHEQDIDVKKPYYSRDVARKVMYNCNFDLFSEKSLAANWRDSLYSVMAPNPANPEEIPETCREITIEYSNYVMNLGYTLLELFSQGLGLKPNHLKEMGCAEGLGILCNYYPKCPQPEVAIGTSRHADNDFFTVLLQDDIGGLQVFHKNQWVDVPPIHGALVVNIGDILQVAERALFLWNNNHVENLIKQNRKVILPIIFPALEKNARGHWNQAVQNLTLNVRKIFSDIDSELFEECLQKFEEDKAQEEEVKRKREITWKRLEELAGMKAASNEPVLVSHKTTPHSPSG